MASVFKRGRKYVVEYLDAAGRRRRKTGFTSKQLTQELARRLERQVEDEKAGRPRARQQTKPEPFAALAAAFADALKARGRTPAYVRNVSWVLGSAAKALGLKTAADLTPAALERRIGQLAATDKAGGTRAEHRDILVRFGHWLVKTGRWDNNRLSGVVSASRAKRAKPRRAFTPDELARLVAAAGARSPGRRLVYRLAAATGLRRSELRRARRSDFNEAADPPVARLRAEATKAGRDEVLPLTPDAVDALREWGNRPLPKTPDWRTFENDLKRAGIAKGPDDRGRWVCFHCLRLTYCVALAKALPIQEVQLLMRHKSIQLTTDTYLRLGLEDLAANGRRLPRLFGPEPPAQGDERQ